MPHKTRRKSHIRKGRYWDAMPKVDLRGMKEFEKKLDLYRAETGNRNINAYELGVWEEKRESAEIADRVYK